MGSSYVGKPIYLISQSDVRYKGILAGIDRANSTIQLSNVFSMGTENRRPLPDFIPPVREPYNFIIFRASEVKDLAVDNEPMPNVDNHTVPTDPAVMDYAQPAPPPPPPVMQQQQQPQQQQTQQQQQQQPRDQRTPNNNNTGPNAPGNRRKRQPQEPMTIPLTDFDFASSNAKFNKPASPAGGDEDGKDPKESAYNPQKSFFDTLTPGPPMAPNGRGGGQGRGGDRGRGGRGRGGRRREEERERNVATFGEPGGVGLLGPGAYVGGWGGYGTRRGGGAGGQRGARRGGPQFQAS